MKFTSIKRSSVLLSRSSILLLGAAVSTAAFGGGFSLNEQSVRAEGQAFSGRTSDADNASTIATNPAGMSFLKQGELSIGSFYIDAHSDIRHASGTIDGAPISGSNDGDMIPGIAIPFAYLVQPLDDHLAVGLGVFSPYGLVTDYESNFQGRYFGTKSKVQIITAQPSVSYKFDNGLAFGFGLTYNKIDGELDKDIPGLGAGPDIVAKVKGDDTAWGYNVGVLYEIDDKTRIGLSYLSQINYRLDGHTSARNYPILGDQRVGASLDLATPEKIDVGFTRQLTQQLTLHGDATQTRWHSLKKIVVENEAPLPNDEEELRWKNAMLYSLGLSYAINDAWTIRGGFAYDESPIPDSTRSVRVPSGDRQMYSIGATWNIQQNLSLDLSYLYFRESGADVDMTGTSPTLHTYSYAAKYDNYANIFGAQLNWKF